MNTYLFGLILLPIPFAIVIGAYVVARSGVNKVRVEDYTKNQKVFNDYYNKKISEKKWVQVIGLLISAISAYAVFYPKSGGWPYDHNAGPYGGFTSGLVNSPLWLQISALIVGLIIICLGFISYIYLSSKKKAEAKKYNFSE
jgi:hypothetical protein